MEFLLELLFEIIGEAIIEGTMSLYIWLMSLIVPEKKISEKCKKTIRITIVVYSLLLIVALIIGVILIHNPGLEILGRYMTFIPLSLIALQFLLGIAFRVFLAIKNKK